MTASPDILVIGAGPAGMAAAVTAAEGGAEILLVDEQPSPGGQIWRSIEAAPARRRALLGEDYALGQAATAGLRAANVTCRFETTVWHLGRAAPGGLEVGLVTAGRAALLAPAQVIVATGAMERPFPIPGWTLPGVMTAGAAQGLLKSAGAAAEGAVFAGTGPLLWLVASQYRAAGLPIAAVLDTTHAAARRRALRHLPAALTRVDMLVKGWRWQRALITAGVPVISGIDRLAVEGDGRAEAVAWSTEDGRRGRIETEHVFLHQGVVPAANLTIAAGLTHDWDEGQLAWVPRLDRWGASSLEGVHVAGDGGGIAGWRAAEARGRLAALDVLRRLSRVTRQSRDDAARPWQKICAQEARIRPFLDALCRPRAAFRVPPEPDTIICRCEELTRADLEPAIAVGLEGPNQLKSFSRAGMGPCQGRLCALTVQGLIAERTGRSLAAVGHYRLRPPIKPIDLAALADMEIADDAA
ncbi:MAG: NAD(P)/FAD-dependent oxidoreductase [Pseudomonadota bacterium]